MNVKSLSFACFFLLGCQKNADKSAPQKDTTPPRINVTTQAVKLGIPEQIWETHAEVETLGTAQVVSIAAGRLEGIFFEPGSRVQRGALLAQLNQDLLKNEHAQALADVEQCKALLALHTSKHARRQAARALDNNVVLQEDWELAESDLRRQAAMCERSVLLASAAATKLQHTQIRAPRTGIMQSRNVVLGQYLQPGTLVGTLTYDQPPRLRFFVPEHVAAVLQPDDVAACNSGTATIRFIAAAAHAENRQIEVHAQAAADCVVRPGTRVPLRLTLPAKHQGIQIPQVAIIMAESGPAVFVVEAGVARRRDVVLAPSNGSQAHVLSGLQIDDAVVVEGAQTLFEGALTQHTENS